MSVSAGVPLSLRRPSRRLRLAAHRLGQPLRRPRRLFVSLANLDIPRRWDIAIRISSGSVIVVGWLLLVALWAGDPRIQLP